MIYEDPKYNNQYNKQWCQNNREKILLWKKQYHLTGEDEK